MSKEEFEVDGANLASLLTPVTGLKFDDPSNRDVALIGECDDVITELVTRLGWKMEFQNLIDAGQTSN